MFEICFHRHKHKYINGQESDQKNKRFIKISEGNKTQKHSKVDLFESNS